MLLANLLPAVAEANPGLIDVNVDNIDCLSILGGSTDVSKATAVALVQRYIEKNGISTSSEMGLEIRRAISATEVASLGSLLCGLTDYQWRGLITLDIFADTLVDRLANLDCAVTEPVKEHLSSLLLEVCLICLFGFFVIDTSQLYGSPDAWTTSDLYSAGWAAASLPPRFR